MGHTFKQQRGRAVGQGAVDYVGMASDPANVGGTPIDLAVVVIEGVSMRDRGKHQVAAGAVHKTLGLSSGP